MFCNTLMPLILVVTAASAFDMDGCDSHAAAEVASVSSTDADITLSIENTWEIDWCSQVLGMDVLVDGSTINIIFSNNTDMEINSLNPATGVTAGSWDLIPENGACFGVVWNDDITSPVWHTDGWYDSCLYYTEDGFSTWQTVSNPSGYDGRGMDYDGDYYWITRDDIGVYRFIPGGSAWYYPMPEVPAQMSGLTVFDYQGDLCVVVNSYISGEWFFYLWQGGSSLTYLGSVPNQLTTFRSAGLTYCSYNDRIYWSYSTTPTTYCISEVSYAIDTALERDTWAGIKAAF